MSRKNTQTKFMRDVDRSIRRLKAVITRVQKMDHADRYYLLDRLKAKECIGEHIEQMTARLLKGD